MTRLAPSGSGDLQLVLFARACVAGARGGGVAAAWAPQLRRWRWPGAGRSGAPSPTPRVPLGRCRPAPWPPLPPARPRPGFSAVTRATAAAAAAAAAAARRLGGRSNAATAGAQSRDRVGSREPRLLDVRLGAATPALAAGGRGVGPNCGLWRVQA